VIPRFVDVAIAGGGPAGLAVAIEAASRGFVTAVLERRPGVPDKACGEGVLPGGVAQLHRLGVLERLGPDDARPFAGIRWLGEDGTAVEGRFPGGAFGLGVRRTALVSALVERAREAGAGLHHEEVVRFSRSAPGVRVETTAGPLAARLLVAADGLASPLRRAAGLEGPAPDLPRRFGVRRHFRLAPWTDLVEVHWSDGAEAYVTPAGGERVGVALLFSPDRTGAASFDALLDRFPALARRLAGAAREGRDLGAGPLAREARGVVAPNLVLVGDAAGYLDAITGEGISLALGDAAALGEVLGAALAAGATPTSLARYARAVAASRRRYVGSTAPVLLLSRRPALRRRILAGLAAHPSIFAGLLGVVAGAGGPPPGLPRPRKSEATAHIL
jgi:flavin-dependent dehydrogenase